MRSHHLELMGRSGRHLDNMGHSRGSTRIFFSLWLAFCRLSSQESRDSQSKTTPAYSLRRKMTDHQDMINDQPSTHWSFRPPRRWPNIHSSLGLDLGSCFNLFLSDISNINNLAICGTATSRIPALCMQGHCLIRGTSITIWLASSPTVSTRDPPRRSIQLTIARS